MLYLIMRFEILYLDEVIVISQQGHRKCPRRNFQSVETLTSDVDLLPTGSGHAGVSVDVIAGYCNAAKLTLIKTFPLHGHDGVTFYVICKF